MSLKSGTRISTYKPVISNNSNGNSSDKNAGRKFAFLSEETVPDYRPVDRRGQNGGQEGQRQAGRRPEPPANTSLTVIKG